MYNKEKLLVIDTETGGLDPTQHSILSLGAVVYGVGGHIEDELYIQIAEPNIVATPAALKVNGIDLTTWVGDDPLQAVVYLKNWLQKNWIRKPVGLAGHNVASFDVGFVKRLFALAGEDYSKVFHYRMLDTMTLAYALDLAGRLPGLRSRGLDALCQRFGIVIRKGEAHNALEDARATAQLLTRLMDMIRDPSRQAPDAPEAPIEEKE
jgi:DNA polymerase-3 subunit epsilon